VDHVLFPPLLLFVAFTPVCSCDHLPSYIDRYGRRITHSVPQTVVFIMFLFYDFPDQILRMGIDEIYCISVNDAFVMRQWGVHQGLKEDRNLAGQPVSILNPGNFTTIKLIPDGAAKFTRAMGMNCKLLCFRVLFFTRLICSLLFAFLSCSGKWENIGGFGERSWRYSAVFNDMKIEKLFLEVCFLTAFYNVIKPAANHQMYCDVP
jgi:peroxiredoxin